METPLSLIPSLMPCELETKKVPKNKESVKTKEPEKQKKVDSRPESEPLSVVEDEDDEQVIVVSNEESLEVSVDDLLRQYSLKQLKAMCTKHSLTPLGSKRELAQKISEHLKFLND